MTLEAFGRSLDPEFDFLKMTDSDPNLPGR